MNESSTPYAMCHYVTGGCLLYNGLCDFKRLADRVAITPSPAVDVRIQVDSGQGGVVVAPAGYSHFMTTTVRGHLRRRLLVNVLVDPDEAASRLLAGVRPHVAEGGTVAGCCMLDIHELRPFRLPPQVGVSIRAAAHRISVEWDRSDGGTEVGVYVPIRLTDSRLAVAAGGRLFPGVHRAAQVELVDDGASLSWLLDDGDDCSIRVRATANADPPDEVREPVGGTCIGASVGLSPRHNGVLEGARMEPSSRQARLVTIEDLESTFVDGFATAVPAPSYLMQDVSVVWTSEPPLD